MEMSKEKSESHRGEADTGAIQLRGDTKRVKILREISNLVHIPEIELLLEKVLLEAITQYGDKISEYQHLMKTYEKELGEEIEIGLSKSKSYFFEFTRVEGPEREAGYKWELGKFKLNVDGKIINMIFSDFIADIDEYETAPNQIQTETVHSAPLNRSFQINFTKSSDARVVGFVKILEDNFVKKNTNVQLTVATTTPGNVQLQKERVTAMMEENPTLSEDITFYAHIIRKLN